MVRNERKGDMNQLKNSVEEEKLLRAQEAEVIKKALGDAIQVQCALHRTKMCIKSAHYLHQKSVN